MSEYATRLQKSLLWEGLMTLTLKYNVSSGVQRKRLNKPQHISMAVEFISTATNMWGNMPLTKIFPGSVIFKVFTKRVTRNSKCL